MVVEKLIYTGILLVAFIVLYVFFDRIVERTIKKEHLRKSRGKLIKKTLNYLLITTGIISLAFVWGINTENIIIFITSTLALVAIGFFAVWSILSNVLAGLIFFFTKPIRTGTEIEIMSEEIRGKITSMGTIFLTIEDKEGNKIYIPNNLLFQKVFKIIYKE
jgi:small-conductance mechanosensitive channel